jgi:hypothetical protein
MRVTRANLVDLAGSEDARETCANGATLREAGAIRVLTLVLERFPRDGWIQEMARALLTELTRDSRTRE